jgi:lambda repressor-like predicted transcriptional regulator
VSKSAERKDFRLDNITQLIKTEIKRQYKSVRQFSEKCGIPYSTLSNALSKGIGGTSYETVIKICNLLNLKQAYDADLTVFNEHCYEICSMLSALDDHAIHTIKTILSVEYERCTKGKKIHSPYERLSIAGPALESRKDTKEGTV